MSARCGKRKVPSNRQRRLSTAGAFAELMDELLRLRSQVRELRTRLAHVTTERNRLEDRLCARRSTAKRNGDAGADSRRRDSRDDESVVYPD